MKRGRSKRTEIGVWHCKMLVHRELTIERSHCGRDQRSEGHISLLLLLHSLKVFVHILMLVRGLVGLLGIELKIARLYL